MKKIQPKQNNLIIYRRRMGFTQKAVAELLGQRDAAMISHYEHGRTSPSLSVALGLEIIYRVPVAFLFPEIYDDLKHRIRAHEEMLTAPRQRALF